MADLVTIHNQSAATAAKEIILPTMQAGGKDGHVMCVLESVITGVLMALYRNPRVAAEMLEAGLVPAVIERLTKQPPLAERKQPHGR